MSVVHRRRQLLCTLGDFSCRLDLRRGMRLVKAGVACFGIKRARGFLAASIKGSDENGKGCSGIQRLCGKGDV